MKFLVLRETLLKPLQAIVGVVEKRHTMAILSNILLQVEQNQLKMTATDLEIELVVTLPVQTESTGAITVPGRKLMDICRGLPEKSMVEISHDSGDKMTIKSGRNRFTLATLPATEFPNIDGNLGAEVLSITQKALLGLIQKTSFAMAQQDVRYFLNGLLLEVKQGILRTVATDGHRLATAHVSIEGQNLAERQLIIPRKAVLELTRLCEENEVEASLIFGEHHVRIVLPQLTITSKLIDGRYPDYQRVIPQKSQNILWVDRDQLKQSLNLAVILSNEKYRAVKLRFEPETLTLLTNNPEQEQAENEIPAEYHGKPFDTGFNITYMLDILSVLPPGKVEISLANATSSALVNLQGDAQHLYVLMPIRL